MIKKTNFFLLPLLGVATSLWSLPMDGPEESRPTITSSSRAGADADAHARDASIAAGERADDAL